MSGPGASSPTSSITLATHGCCPSARRFADGGEAGLGLEDETCGLGRREGRSREEKSEEEQGPSQ